MTTQQRKPIIVVQGGAGLYDVNESEFDRLFVGVRKAALAGWRVLVEGGTALDAVQVANVIMEDFPLYNAGRGSYLTRDGKVSMSAFLMDGHNLRVGGVANISGIRNPILFARAVMDKTDHSLFRGDAADYLVNQFGIERVDDESLVTDKSKRRLREFMEKRAINPPDITASVMEKSKEDHDTVGAVALDQSGHLAAATSTGGKTGQLPGRVSDTPLTGSGGYADDECGAVSTTGDGEAILRVCLASHCLTLMRNNGMTPSQAGKEALRHMHDRVQGIAGLIALDHTGQIGIEFTTKGMVWAFVQDDLLHTGMFPGEDFVEPVQSDF